MTQDEAIKYWQDGAADDYETAEILFKEKKFHHALFFCHLTLEKLLKGLIIKNSVELTPPIHNLVILARRANLTISVDLEKELNEITTWNITARYDNIKRVFYKKATKEFSTMWFQRVKEIYKWLLKQY